MPLILNIETTSGVAKLSLANNGKIIISRNNPDQKDHASWMHVALSEIISEAKIHLRELAAVAVAAGPGSYTGIRVGMATAKGFCFALNIPMISENTLKIMAGAQAVQHTADGQLFAPMIDARRMEVFTAVYDRDLNELMAP